MAVYKSFGEAATAARRNARLTLREAARQLGATPGEVLSPSYLSKIELDRCPPPSANLIQRMAAIYQTPVESLMAYAKQRVPDMIGERVAQSRELAALYSVTSDMAPEEILRVIQELINRLPTNEREKWEAKIKAEFPRAADGQALMYAPRVKPRYFSKLDLRRAAIQILEDHGLNVDTYFPPTPIEEIIENTPGIKLHPSDGIVMQWERCGSPVVLGRTKWDYDGKTRIIEINESLYTRSDSGTRHRLHYTLAHEFWHALEHLPLMDIQARSEGGMFRIATDESPSNQSTRPRWWEKAKKRRLETNEDWQEWQAKFFAAEILMPHWSIEEEFLRRFGSIELETPQDCEQMEFADELAGLPAYGNGLSLNDQYCVSRQAMAIRLCTLNLVRSAFQS